ncbi:hypothetical protein H8B02_29195 [Bradyrhizobium sp. Pear77]|uniref:hypothetical protein n=1 Tax=Bradyrhizobium altum TaxID=1571202 RepID=UPI001E4A66FB|nr:hypothetical protein [Bradyrhizobium altum]MCC8957366.1 hypothetical protein [Bradyrhizobium altum]
MGHIFYPLETLPLQYDIVWCLYPESGLTPGPIARPSLVLDVRVNQQQKIGAVICTYGTGEFEARHYKEDLIIPPLEYQALGLHKPTRFALGLNSRMQLAWGPKYFVAPEYAKSQNLIIGGLNGEQIDRMLERLKRRGLEPYA